VSSLAGESNNVQADIDHLLAGLGQRVNLEERMDRVARHGTNAVPPLVETYAETGSDRRWMLAACLCRIGDDESLGFLRTILRSHEDRRATTEVIVGYPLAHEDQILPLLIDLLEVPQQSFHAQERLQNMIFRKPERAGVLVGAMDPSVESPTGRNWLIGEVLAYVSGHSHTWCCFGPADTNWGAWQHAFWTAWWERNRGKEPVDWLVETFRSDPKNDSRQSQALQILGVLKDPRVVPVLLEGLGAESERVRYWAVVGLKRLEETLDASGYTVEAFREEEARVIEHLRRRFTRPEAAGPSGKREPGDSL